MKKLLVLLIVVAASLAGGAYWISNSQNGRGGGSEFTFANVEHGSMIEAISATGVLQPREVVAVGSELSGRVVEIYPRADFNRIVEEGEPLLKLDDRLARQRLEQAAIGVRAAQADRARAEAQRDSAQIQVKWLTDLRRREASSQADLDQAEMQLRAAEAAVQAAQVKIEEAQAAEQQARLGLELTVVRVPMRPDRPSDPTAPKETFVVLDRQVVLGQMVAPPASAQLFTLAAGLEQMKVHAQVAEGDVARVFPGQVADFTVSSYSEEDLHFRGKVTEVRLSPTRVQAAVFYEAIIEVLNVRDSRTGEWQLRPGMTASVDLVLREHVNVWKMPTAAFSYVPPEDQQTTAARNKLARWQQRSDRDQWRPVWVWDGKQQWPVFVRVGDVGIHGEKSIQDVEFTEVLEWDPELTTQPDPKEPASYPRVILGGPIADEVSIFNPPPVKL